MEKHNNDACVIPLMHKPISIDGKVDPEKWKEAFSFTGFVSGDLLEKRQLTAFLGATVTHFYIGMQIELPPSGKPV